LILLEDAAREGPGDKNQNRRSAGAVMVRTTFHRRPYSGTHDVLLVVVGGSIRTYKRLVLLLGRPHVSARTPLVAWAYSWVPIN